MTKVAEHLKIMVEQFRGEAGDAVSANAVALGHATAELVADVQKKIDELSKDVSRQVHRHPGEAAALTAAAALLTAAVASLTTYALTRRHA
ncbi:MAG: hypothetical protein J7521_04370 [Caulobacter sp.]|nr:hypothetical protein [Caulobacter sp.]